MDQCTENYECLVINNNAKVINYMIKFIGIKQTFIQILKLVLLNFGNILKKNYSKDDNSSDGAIIKIKKTLIVHKS